MVLAPREAVKVPLLTGTSVLEAQFSLLEVTIGVIADGAVPPVMVIGTEAAAPLLMATITTYLFPPLKAVIRTSLEIVPVVITRIMPGRTYLVKLPKV